MWGTLRRDWKTFAVVTALIAVAFIYSAPPELSATVPQPSLVLQTSGGTVRDNSVIASGTALTTSVGGLLAEGTGSRELRIDLPKGVVYQAGGATAPEGWTVEYSTNGGGAWSTSEPNPASGVTNVRAVNASVIAGAVGESTQTYTRNVTSNLPVSTFGASTGGDGWDVFFYDNYVLNIFHHDDGAIRLDCHLRAAAGGLSGGARCAGFDPTDSNQADGTGSAFPGYRASDRSGGWVDGANGKMYAFTAQSSSGKPGVLCIRLSVVPPSSCGFTALSDDTDVNSYLYLSNAEGVDGRLFGIETQHNKLLCFDPATGAACVNSPVQLTAPATGAGETEYSTVYPLGTKVFATTRSTLHCFEAATLATCAGSWPVSYASLSWTAIRMPPIAHLDTSGVLDGVCLSNGCLDLTGAKRTGTGWVNPHTVTSWGEGGAGAITDGRYGRYGSFVVTAGRAFLPMILHYGATTVYCFNYATNAACSGFDTTPFNAGKGESIYAVRADPNDPNCVFFNEHAGNIGLFSAITGAASCAATPVITMQPSQFAPRFVCTTSGGIDRWKSITLNGVNAGATATSRKLTIRKANGDAIAGWTDVDLAVGTAKDLSSLDVAVSGSRPTFNVTFGGVTGSLTSADFTIIYDGRGPELCLNTVLSNTAVTGSPACPVIDGSDGIVGTLTQNVSGSTTATAPFRAFTISGNAGQCAQNISYAGPPGKPSNPTCLKSTSKVDLTFAAPTDDGGSAVRWYELTVNGGSSWTVLSSTLNAGTYSASVAMSTGSVTNCGVRAVNVLGNGAAETVTATTINVTYDGNGRDGGSVPVDSTNYANGGTVTVVGNTGLLTKAGYTFAGWCTTQPLPGSPCGGVARAATATFTITSSTILYAVWTADTLNVTYDSQGGSAIAGATTTTGASIAASPGSPTREGYTFAGWFTSLSGGSAITFPHVHGETSDFSRFARWTPNTLTVTYDSRGGSAIASGTTTTGASIAASPGTPTRTGYGFLGWFAATTGGDALTFPYAHGRTSDFTLYARWAGNPHVITYDGNGSTGGKVPAAGAGVFGSTFTVAGNSGSLVRSGFAFAGWNTKADGSGTDHAPGTGSFVVSGDATLYAVWTDATAPSAPTAPDLVASSDSGVSSSDDLTKLSTVSISVKAAESGGTVVVTAVKEESTVGTVSVMASTASKSCTMVGSTAGGTCELSGLTDGSWKVSSTQADAEKNESDKSASLTIVIDSIAPPVTLATPSDTSSVVAISFSVSSIEAIDCSTLSSTASTDFDVTEISSLDKIEQGTPTKCVISATSTARAGGGTVVSTLSAAQFFAISDLAGNSQTTLREPSKSVRVTIPEPQRPSSAAKKTTPVTVSDSSALITFKPSTESASVKSYRYSIDGGKTWKTAKVSVAAGGKLAIEVEGLEVGEKYTVQIQAVMESGGTEVAAAQSFTTKSPLPRSGSDAASGFNLAMMLIAIGLLSLVLRARSRSTRSLTRPTR